MENNTQLQPQKPVSRHNLTVMAFAVVAVLIVVGGYVLLTHTQNIPYIQPAQQPATSTEGLTRSLPTHLRIPKLNIDTTFEEPLGLNDDRTIEVPDTYTQVGWYKHGAAPGEVGTASILGHVDSYEGPAVFYPLGQLEPGDEIEITREDGSVAVFVVEKSERYSQDDFPTEKVYGPTDYPSLRLITCSGVYDRGSQRYSHNLVVYANLKETPESVQASGS